MNALQRSSLQCLGKAVWSAVLFISLAGFAAEQVETTGTLTVPRKNHTATVLVDGRVVVIGGENSAGQLASAEVYDPATHVFTAVGAMSRGRVGHAATLLANGTVLVTGGRDLSGPLASAEIFDPNQANSFRLVTGSMGAARSRHTATLMANGKVLIAGGDLIGTAEIFDPATETFSTSLIAMIEPRTGQSATTLQENSILLAGGGTRSVELFDPQTSLFLSWPSVLNEIRSGQSAITAADSSVFFIGGEDLGTLERFDLLGNGSSNSLSLGSPSSSASQLANGKVLVLGSSLSSLFNPATSTLLPIENAGILQRSGQTVTELPAEKKILVVGGVDSTTAYVAPAATYNPARIETDKQDYYPDEPVIVYGSGWKPGENVDLYVVDNLGWLYDSTSTADLNGLFTADPYFVVLMQHLGVTFDLKAVGAQSGLQAQHTFTDAPRIGATVTVGPQSQVLTYGTGGTVTYSVKATRIANGTVNGTYSVLSGLPVGVTASFPPPNPFNANGGNAFPFSTLTLTVSATVPAGSYPFTVKCADGSDSGTGTETLVIGQKNLTVTGAVANNKAYNGDNSATVNFSGATLIGIVSPDVVTINSSGYTATFNDKNVGTSKAVTVTGVTLSGAAAGNYTVSQPAGLTANITAKNLTITGAIANNKVYNGDSSATVNFGSATLVGIVSPDIVTINSSGYAATFSDKNVGTAKAVTVTGVVLGGAGATNYTVSQPIGLTANITGLGITGNFTASNKTYDGNATATIVTRTLTGVIAPDVVTLTGGTATFDTANAGTAKTVTGTGFTLGGANAGNYSLSSVGSTTADVQKANATIVVTAYNVTYDATAHTAAGTAKGVLNESLSGLDLSGTTHTNAGSYSSDAWTFTDVTGNYNNATGTVSDSIAKANATVNVTGYTGIYDGTAHGATGTASGVNSVDLSASLNLGASFTHVPGGTANWIFTGGTNYNDQNGTAPIVINKANATIVVTPYNVTYDATAHTASGSAKGVLNETLSGLDLSATTHTNAGTYVSDAWTFTDVTGDYNNASGTTSDHIAKANASINVTPYSVTYSGGEHVATGTAKGVLNELLAGLNLNGTKHTNAGIYASDAWTFIDVTGNYNDANGTVSDTIAKATATISVTPYSVVYSGLAHTATGTATGVMSETLAGLDLTATTHTNAGTYSGDVWVFTDVTGNYHDATATITDSIAKADALIVVTPYSVTYDATAHTASGTAKGVQNEILAGLDLSATTHTNAGTYASDAWTFTDVTGNYNNSAGTVSDTIAKADALVSVTGYTGIYDASAHGATGTATGVGGMSLAGLDLGASFTNVPGGTANWTFTGGINYNDQSGTAAIVINKATAAISVTPYHVTYDGNPHTATGTAIGVSGADLSAGLNLSGTTHTNAGTYTDTWTFSGGTNYHDQTNSVSDIIAKANAVVSVSGYTGVYDAAAHGATGTATGVQNEPLAGLNLGASFTDVPGGTANWAFTDLTGNYNDASGAAEIVITKATAIVTVSGYSGTYDAAAHGATGTATGIGGVNLSAGLNLGASFTDVPGGTANWTFTGGINYNDQNGSAAIVITKATAVISVTPYNVTYNGNPHTATGTAIGVSGADLSAGLNLSGTTHTNAGTYTDTWTFSGGTNYNDQTNTVSDIIAKANAVVSVSGYTGVYDASAHGATGTATGVKGELLAGLNLGALFTNVPGGTANWIFIDITGNYNNDSGTAAIVITKATANVTVSGYTGIYNATAHGATGSATGVGGVDLSAGLNLGATFTDVPGGTAHWTFSGGTNYDDASGDVAISISQAVATIVVTPYSVIYDGNLHTATGTATGVGGADLSGGLTLSGTTHTNAGTYNGDAWSFAGGTNYTNQSGTVNDFIAKADAIVTVNGHTGVYDGAPHGATGSATGIGNVNLSAGLNLGATFTNVPGGTAHWTFSGGTNYNDQSGTAPIVIGKADASVTVNGYTGIYDGAAHGATGSASGIGGVSLSGLTLGASFTNVPGGTANWAFTDVTGNYNDKVGTAAIVITKATASISVSGLSVTYDGAAHGANGTATGVNSEDLSSQLNLGASFTDAPGGTAHWTFSGGTNYADASGNVAITINKADASVIVNGYSGVYNAAAHGATGSASGIGGVNLTSDLNLGATFTDAPGGNAHWSFNGGLNYNNQSGDVAIVIGKADANVLVIDYTGVFDGLPHGATGSASGIGGVNLAAELNLGATFTNAPGGTAHWSFAGGTNYNDQSGSASIVINKAVAVISVTPYNAVYNGNSHVATGTATGVGGANLNASLTLSGTAHTNAGNYSDSWSFAGGTNYSDQSGSVSDAITKANASIIVTPYNVTYDGVAHTATGSATGVQGESLAGLNLSGTTHTNAGAYPSDTWTFTDVTGNYFNASSTVSDNIAKANPTITWSNPASIVYGTALSATQLNATASVPGTLTYSPAAGTILNAGANQILHVSFTPSDSVNYNSVSKDVMISVAKATPVITWSNPASIVYGTALSATQLNATANVPGTLTYKPAAGTIMNTGVDQILHVDFVPTDSSNYENVSKEVKITVNVWAWTGFFQPVDNYPILNRVKAGSAIPVKFSLGGNKGLAIFENGYPLSGTIPTTGSEPTIDIEVTVNAGASSLSYDAGSNQYVYVWKTDKSWSGSSRRLLLKLKDGTLHYADFNFTK